jgi:hypothetical protein
MEDICKSLEWEDEGTSASAKKDDKGVDLPINAGENADDQAWLNRFAALTVEEDETGEMISRIVRFLPCSGVWRHTHTERERGRGRASPK